MKLGEKKVEKQPIKPTRGVLASLDASSSSKSWSSSLKKHSSTASTSAVQTGVLTYLQETIFNKSKQSDRDVFITEGRFGKKQAISKYLKSSNTTGSRDFLLSLLGVQGELPTMLM